MLALATYPYESSRKRRQGFPGHPRHYISSLDVLVVLVRLVRSHAVRGNRHLRAVVVFRMSSIGRLIRSLECLNRLRVTVRAGHQKHGRYVRKLGAGWRVGRVGSFVSAFLPVPGETNTGCSHGYMVRSSCFAVYWRASVLQVIN